MTYPVYIGDRAAGTMTVTAAGEDHLFEVICHPPEPGLWRVWVQGEGQRLALGLLEGGRLRLAAPYDREGPFPLTELFCLARIRAMDGGLWAEYRFEDGYPVPPEEN